MAEPYALAKRLKQGGMAEVFLARQAGADGFARVCAVKRILPEFAEHPEIIEVFRDEAHISRRLRHDNVVQVHDFCRVGNTHAIVMEFVNGIDLQNLLARAAAQSCPLSVPMAAFIAAEAARGLHHAHTRKDEVTGKALGIVHRDVSPQNILLGFEGEVKVGDFGIAFAREKIHRTRPGVLQGKFAYMSPEQAAGAPLDARSDLFSLGLVLYEMLAGRRLFDAKAVTDVIALARAADVEEALSQDLPRRNPGVDRELVTILAKALAKDPDRRFTDIHAFERALRRLIAFKHPSFAESDVLIFVRALASDVRRERAADIRHILGGNAPAAPLDALTLSGTAPHSGPPAAFRPAHAVADGEPPAPAVPTPPPVRSSSRTPIPEGRKAPAVALPAEALPVALRARSANPRSLPRGPLTAPLPRSRVAAFPTGAFGTSRGTRLNGNTGLQRPPSPRRAKRAWLMASLVTAVLVAFGFWPSASVTWEPAARGPRSAVLSAKATWDAASRGSLGLTKRMGEAVRPYLPPKIAAMDDPLPYPPVKAKPKDAQAPRKDAAAAEIPGGGPSPLAPLGH